MKVLRTPDERFENLPGYDFAPNYLSVDDGEGGELRIHYLEKGPEGGTPVLMMHGEPSWSYLYRKMIPPFVEAGYRVLAPDLVGFGRSDKPTEREDYTYARHVYWMQQWLDRVGVEGATLVVGTAAHRAVAAPLVRPLVFLFQAPRPAARTRASLPPSRLGKRGLQPPLRRRRRPGGDGAPGARGPTLAPRRRSDSQQPLHPPPASRHRRPRSAPATRACEVGRWRIYGGLEARRHDDSA